LTRFAANVSLLFAELPFCERFAAARAAGFETVELHWPRGEDLDAVVRAVADADLAVCLMNFDGGDPAAGDRGLMATAERQAEWRHHVPVALDLARRLRCPVLHALVGVERPGGREEQLAHAAGELQFAADAAAPQGATVVVEALNPVDNGPVLLQTNEDAAALLARAARPNTGLQFDAYHAAMIGRDPVAELERHFPQVRHVQVADCPGRGERGTGQMDVDGFLAALDRLGWAGPVGLEYRPSTGDTVASLAAWGAGSRP
jgi:hydroxypyruvate isomerase